MANDYEQERVDKLQRIRDLGFDPYNSGSFDGPVTPNSKIADKCFFDNGEGKTPFFALKEANIICRGYGRVMLRRTMGNLHFLTVRDDTGDIQVALSKKSLDERTWNLAKLVDLGDIIQFQGYLAPTDKGEPTIWANKFVISCKSLVTPPEKHVGLTDPELRYRHRYIDLHNPDVMRQMRWRSEIVAALRSGLARRRFLEVETPILQTQAGGATATPFETHHNALDVPMSLRIAPELYLKRLVVGGMPRVFEIGRNFRNEGISTRHNPEFTALEVYEAYGSWETMANLAVILIEDAIPCGSDLAKKWMNRPWRTVKMMDLVREFDNATHYEHSDSIFFGGDPTPEQAHKIYEESIEKTLIDPTFVTHFPASKVPLAANDGNGFALNWELVINGMEIGCGYTEQTDPLKQLKAFEAQGTPIDYDFIHALHVGMPPSGGMGIGIDRLVMVLTEQPSIRDVILFPQMRPEKFGS